MSHKDIPFSSLEQVKYGLYHISDRFSTCNLYDSNEVQTALNVGQYEFIAAFGVKRELPLETEKLFKSLHTPGTWIFAQINYQDILHQNTCKGFFYEPLLICYILKNTQVLHVINNGLPENEIKSIEQALQEHPKTFEVQAVHVRFEPLTRREDYLRQVEAIKSDIISGKYYEMNYCIEFRSACEPVDLLPYFIRLNEKTRAPFAAFVKHPGFTLLCSSPERFLLKQGSTLISQPIKGTNKRLEGEDNTAQMQDLANSEKERAENVMIVDLVRNDLARVCKSGSVKVDELCGAYVFKSVNHLISTVRGELQEEKDFHDIMLSLFPMGSMTGAPKMEVMKHIGLYEHEDRGLYSGCLGYIDPNGDFDFNVVIRSLYYDIEKSEVSYKVGSAITFDSVAEQEYEECLLKGRRLFEVMTDKLSEA